MNIENITIVTNSTCDERDRIVKELKSQLEDYKVTETRRFTHQPIEGMGDCCLDAIVFNVTTDLNIDELSVAIEDVSCRMSDVLMYFYFD